ncbi:gliding motility-associated ABC transporter substrate-binding protein GldG [Dysgonomonas sp. 25]|uniref:gliding motility-associated ABC transporter substrate-binding protein GldG n=1 Tax=Dysgonomonas sp. 25 TaxID=2302933 RepID=UPI0013D60F33|nr:gliding motility-associated ABC transporter substrate-binding protein GldG [Dysgonomonas sp. 25]NDV68518.1 gliding motility-associated ABC transporter substrate-binding protein GldG [Dysgonomonas sp. 25]
MKALIIKELKSVFCSPAGAFFAVSYLLISGCVLWLFSGSFNIPESGYASLQPFFHLSPILLAVLIPALTMRQFAEERRLKTLNILRARPVSFGNIYSGKALATIVFILITLATTLIYAYSVYRLANPAGNVDLASIGASYISLLLISAVFVAIGLFTSSISQNQIIALLTGIFLCLFSFFGFELISGLFLSGKTQLTLSSLGLNYHYSVMQRGVMPVGGILVAVNYILLFFFLTLLVCQEKKSLRLPLALLVAVNATILLTPNIRFDFTEEKRYTLSDYTKNLLSEVKEKPLQIDVYLEGDLNAGFLRLRNETFDILSDMNRYAGNNLTVKPINPYHISRQPNQSLYNYMVQKGMDAITLNESDREGKISRKEIYPYAQVISGEDTLVVSLGKYMPGYTADENIHAAIESLEFEFTDAIRLLVQQKQKTVAFIEGHGELPREYLYNAEDLLAKYYDVIRGEIWYDTSIMNFDALIIAGPRSGFSEREKYVIDQYIMHGGKVLWLIDGAYYSSNDLRQTGTSASMKNDTNLDDLLFSYGVRVNPDFVQDKQCASIYLATGGNNNAPALMPCYYIPYLMPSTDNPITKYVRDIRAPFSSSIDILRSSEKAEKKILLTTANNSHIVKVPELITFDVEEIQNNPAYFDQAFITTAVSLEGVFNSAFTNRLIPTDEEIEITRQRLNESKPTRMIVVSSSEIIRNYLHRDADSPQPLFSPMGYDPVEDRIAGNRDFFVNAVNWLTDDDGITRLRTKQQQLRTLNKKQVYEAYNQYAALNIALPIAIILGIMGCTYFYRKRKYEK